MPSNLSVYSFLSWHNPDIKQADSADASKKFGWKRRPKLSTHFQEPGAEVIMTLLLPFGSCCDSSLSIRSALNIGFQLYHSAILLGNPKQLKRRFGISKLLCLY